MKKHLVFLSTLVLFAFCACSKFAGDPVSKDFSINGSYAELEVEDAFDVYVDSTATQITVTVGENIMPKVVVEKVGNTLKIHLKGINQNIYGSDMKVVVPYNADLTSVDLSGASEFHSEYGLKGKKVEIDLSGSSDFFGDILADNIDMDLSGSSSIKGYVEALELDLEMTGSSDATFEGQVGLLKMDLNGSSDIMKTINGNRYGFACDHCEGSMSGSSNAYIHCDGSIKVNLSGSSELHFTGDGNPADSHTSGSSDICHDTL